MTKILVETTEAEFKYSIQFRLDGVSFGLGVVGNDWELTAIGLGRAMMGVLYPGGLTREEAGFLDY